MKDLTDIFRGKGEFFYLRFQKILYNQYWYSFNRLKLGFFRLSSSFVVPLDKNRPVSHKLRTVRVDIVPVQSVRHVLRYGRFQDIFNVASRVYCQLKEQPLHVWMTTELTKVERVPLQLMSWMLYHWTTKAVKNKRLNDKFTWIINNVNYVNYTYDEQYIGKWWHHCFVKDSRKRRLILNNQSIDKYLAYVPTY